MGRDPSNAVYFTTYAISGLGLLIMAPLTIGYDYDDRTGSGAVLNKVC